jgi:hypothetical protein
MLMPCSAYSLDELPAIIDHLAAEGAPGEVVIADDAHHAQPLDRGQGVGVLLPRFGLTMSSRYAESQVGPQYPVGQVSAQ